MILLTSLPTYPTSVNFVAYTLMKGALVSLAKRLASSVLPDPVGPDINIFFGATSLRMCSGRHLRRHRFRMAIANDFFALD